MDSNMIRQKSEKKPMRWWYPATIVVIVALSSIIITMVILNRNLSRKNKSSSAKKCEEIDRVQLEDGLINFGTSKNVISRDIIPSDPTNIPHLSDVAYWRKIIARNARIGYVFSGGVMNYVAPTNTFSAFNWNTSYAESSVGNVLYNATQNINENVGFRKNSIEESAFEQITSTNTTSNYSGTKGYNVIFLNQQSIGLRSSYSAGELTYKRSLESIILRFGLKTEIKATLLATGDKTGTWTNGSTGVSLLNSIVQDSSLTFTFTIPSTTIIVLISTTLVTTLGSTFDIYVDGQLNTSGNNVTQAGTNATFVMMSIRLSDLSNTNHVIKVVKTGATGTLHVYGCYIYDPIVSPTYICKEYYALPAGYATFTPPPTNADIDRYNGYIDQVVDSFPPEIKNNITIIDINTRWNPTIHLSYDQLSPNDLGTRLIADMILNKLGEREIRLGSHIVRADYDGLLPSLTEDEDYWVDRYRRDYKNARLWYYTFCRCYGHEFSTKDDTKTFSTVSFARYMMKIAKFSYYNIASGTNDTMEDSAMVINGGIYTIEPKGFMGVITLMSNQYNVCMRSHLPLAELSFKNSLMFFIAKCASRETTSATVAKKTGSWNTIRLINAGDRTATYQASTVENSSIEFNFEFPSTAVAIAVYGVPDESGSTYDVYVDGQLNTSGNTSSQSLLGNRVEAATAPGAPNIILIKNLTKLKHSIRIVKTGSSGTLHVDSAFVYNAEEAPYLIIMKDTYCAPSGYARFTVSNPTDATVDEYNKYIDDVVAMFPEIKKSIKILDPNGSGWDPQIHILSDRDDGQHPNDLGARFLAEMIIDDLSNIEIQKGTNYIK